MFINKNRYHDNDEYEYPVIDDDECDDADIFVDNYNNVADDYDVCYSNTILQRV